MFRGRVNFNAPSRLSYFEIFFQFLIRKDSKQSPAETWGLGDGPAKSFGRTAHASVSPIFWELMFFEVCQSTNWLNKRPQEELPNRQGKGQRGEATCHSTEKIRKIHLTTLKRSSEILGCWMENGNFFPKKVIHKILSRNIFPSPQTWCQVSAHANNPGPDLSTCTGKLTPENYRGLLAWYQNNNLQMAGARQFMSKACVRTKLPQWWK